MTDRNRPPLSVMQRADLLRAWEHIVGVGEDPKIVEEALRRAADDFHRVLASFSARRLIDCDRDNLKLTTLLRDKLLEPQAIEKICADGFERCVRALAAIGADGVTIHECNPSEEHW